MKSRWGPPPKRRKRPAARGAPENTDNGSDGGKIVISASPSSRFDGARLDGARP